MSEKYTSELSQTANKHMYIGMVNESSLEKEGGPLIIKDSEGIYLNSIDDKKYIDDEADLTKKFGAHAIQGKALNEEENQEANEIKKN